MHAPNLYLHTVFTKPRLLKIFEKMFTFKDVVFRIDLRKSHEHLPFCAFN